MNAKSKIIMIARSSIFTSSCILLCLLSACSSLLAQNDTLLAREYYKEGKKLYYSADYKKSKKTFLKAINLQKKLFGSKSQELAKTLHRLSKTERRMQKYELARETSFEALDMAKSLDPLDHILIANITNELGNNYNILSDTKNSLQYFNLALEHYKKANGMETEVVGGQLMNLGMVYTDLGFFRQAENHFQKAYAIFKKVIEPNSSSFNRLYINMANLYLIREDYEKTIEFGKMALNVKLKNYKPTHPSVAKYYGLVGEGYEGKKDYEEALKYMHQYVELITAASGDRDPNTADANVELANIYLKTSKYDAAEKLYRKSLKIYRANEDFPKSGSIAALNNIGKCFEVKEEYEKALKYYGQSKTIYNENDYLPPSFLTSIERRVSRALSAQGKDEQALLELRQAISHLVPEFKYEPKDVFANPSIDKVEEMPSLLKVLDLKTEILKKIYKKRKKINYLKAAFETSELAIVLVEKMRKSYLSEGSKKLLNERSASIFDEAVSIAFELYQITAEKEYLIKAFYLSEKAKGSILWQSLNEQNAFDLADIPASDLSELYSLEREISSIEKHINRDKGSSKLDSLNIKLFSFKRKYEAVLSEVENKNKNFYSLKYASNEIVIENLISQCSIQNAAILNYHHSEEELFLFFIDKAGLKGVRKELGFDLKQKIETFRKNASLDVLNDNAKIKTYLAQLHDMYKLLLAPIEDELSKEQKLIVIPHAYLNYLSFDCLTKNLAQGFSEADFLIKDHPIQYGFSLSLWNLKNEESKSKIKGFVGFAPDFKQSLASEIPENQSMVFRVGEVPLKYSIPEIEVAEKYFNGKKFINEEATESQFLNIAEKANIIHLATHAVADDKFPLQSGLLFSTAKDSIEDGFLSSHEIYRLKLKADLAVMSACNTGYGQLSKGEGVMSLGRAFVHAGCRSVLMSLWLANDNSTSKIIQNFYKNASRGISKDESLRKAKLDYLDQADALTSHPYFWAGMVAVGDMSPLNSNSNAWIYFVFISLGILLLFWMLRKK